MIDNNNNQFVVSYELLHLFRWLFDHEQETMKKLMTKSLRNGLSDKLYAIQAHKEETTQEIQQSVVDFFALLETLLYEIINEEEVRRIVQRNLIPAIDHIDATVCDTATVALSLAKATSALENNPNTNAKEVLCKELLRRWKPAKKLSTH